MLFRSGSPAGQFQTSTIERGNLTATVGATGTVRARQTATLVWQTTGTVEKVNVKIGDEVKAGDQVSELNGAKLVVDAESAVFLEGAKLDFVREGLKQAFKFDNPNVEASCGCGESVSFKSDAGAAAKA